MRTGSANHQYPVAGDWAAPRYIDCNPRRTASHNNGLKAPENGIAGKPIQNREQSRRKAHRALLVARLPIRVTPRSGGSAGVGVWLPT